MKRFNSDPQLIRRALRDEDDPWISALYQKRLDAIKAGNDDAHVYELAWEVLVKYAGAYEDPKHDAREQARFVGSCMDESYGLHSAFEYRFGGKLGFGGKFWRQGILYVTCYSEDETPDRRAIINKINRILKNLVG